ncbi:GAF domain-containing sensor histidine kinase [Pontibacter rugosus]|uniref:ATP-binding protein n=1 Tax=Pontibacter rugosus TaxID=1745966 RepID=A0ABW3SLK9_9BACT
MADKVSTIEAAPYKYPASIIPDNDKGRLHALYRYEILDSPPEPFFEKVTRLAAKLLHVPSAFVSLVDQDRVWYKSNYSSLDVPCVDRKDSLCSLTVINDQDLTVFEDTHLVPELLSSPYVDCEGGIRFYAGAPLVTHDGYNLGTLCVVSNAPRQLSDDEKETLRGLASLVMEHIEMRAMARKAVRRHDELHTGVMVGIDVPLKKQVELLQEAKKVPRPVHIINKTQSIANAVLTTTANLLYESGHEEKQVLPQRELVSIADIAKDVANTYEATVEAKNQELFFSVASRREMHVDPKLLHKAFALLVEHLIKYTLPKSSIAIDVFEDDGKFRVEVSNEDSSLTEPDLVKMFYKYAALSGKATGNENSTGLELAQAKEIVESHGGKVWAEATSHRSATKIIVEFPVD